MKKDFGPIYDPDAEKRSKMLRRKVLCNGEATGVRCAHYWTMIRNEPSQNPDSLTKGAKLRFCRAWGAEPLEFGEGTSELATLAPNEQPFQGCTMYYPAGTHHPAGTPDLHLTAEDALVGITKTALARRHLHDPSFESFEDNAEELEEAFREVPLSENVLFKALSDEVTPTDANRPRPDDDTKPDSPVAKDSPGAATGGQGLQYVSLEDMMRSLPTEVAPKVSTLIKALRWLKELFSFFRRG